jgi:DNA-binding NarL/FixJ family response regulator
VMDGVEASKLIHAEQPELPIVLVSGSMFADRVGKARSAAASGYVQKSRVETDLIETILAVIEEGRQAAELLRANLAPEAERQTPPRMGEQPAQ